MRPNLRAVLPIVSVAPTRATAGGPVPTDLAAGSLDPSTAACATATKAIRRIDAATSAK